MADNYLGRQSLTRTGGGPIYSTLHFQVPDMLTARGQRCPAARQSQVRFPVTYTDAGQMPAYFKLGAMSWNPAIVLVVRITFIARTR